VDYFEKIINIVGFQVLMAVSTAIALMMEAGRTSETLVTSTRQHGVTTQKTAIFIINIP
jgi:hypothetical protein